MTIVSDFSDLFIKSGNYLEVNEDSDDSSDDLFENNGTKSVRFCKASEVRTKELVICKVFDPSVLQEDIDSGSDKKQDHSWYRQQMLIREALILKELNHPAIVKFIGVHLYNTTIKFDYSLNYANPTIFLEYLSNKSIQSHIDKYKLDIPPVKRQICMVGITAAIRFLHSRNILHRSLNPNSIWLNEDFHPKIFDFSVSRQYNTGKDTPKYTNIIDDSVYYTAPEVFEELEQYDDAIDIFSLGRLFYLMITGYEPFKATIGKKKDKNYHTAPLKLQTLIVNDSAKPEYPGNVSKEFQALLERCWSSSPQDRPTAAEIYDLITSNEKYIIKEVETEKDRDEINNYIKSIEQFEKENPKTDDFLCYKLQL